MPPPRLKTIDVVMRNTKDAEDTLKTYETRLRDVNKVPTDRKEVENYRSQLKVRGEEEPICLVGLGSTGAVIEGVRSPRVDWLTASFDGLLPTHPLFPHSNT